MGVSVLPSAKLFYLLVFFLVSSKENGGQCKCNLGRLKNRTNLLRKYIEDINLELQALFAVQSLFVQLGYPPGINLQTCCLSSILFSLTMYFNLLCRVIKIIVLECAAYHNEQLLIIRPQICARAKAKCMELYPGHVNESSLASYNHRYDGLRNSIVDSQKFRSLFQYSVSLCLNSSIF